MDIVMGGGPRKYKGLIRDAQTLRSAKEVFAAGVW